MTERASKLEDSAVRSCVVGFYVTKTKEGRNGMAEIEQVQFAQGMSHIIQNLNGNRQEELGSALNRTENQFFTGEKEMIQMNR